MVEEPLEAARAVARRGESLASVWLVAEGTELGEQQAEEAGADVWVPEGPALRCAERELASVRGT